MSLFRPPAIWRAWLVLFSFTVAVTLGGVQTRVQSPQPQHSQPQPGQTQPGQLESSQAPSPQASSPPPPSSEAPLPPPQVPLQFESHGMQYEALTHEGITVMYAPLPPRVKDFSIVQVTVTNGSLVSWTVKPSDFTFVREDGVTLPSLSADYVVASLMGKASRTDVIKLQLMYEDSIYALSNFRATNGYEKRREAAMAMFVNREFKAAAAASAITLVPLKLKPSESTDGAVFFESHVKDKPLGPGRLVVRTCGQVFVFQTFGELRAR